jgi:N-acetyl-alpha-D-muramate 1-phosphate uridylyltransferase
MFPVAILAGGLATRLRPMTETVPKAMLPCAGRPFIHWQLEMLARSGITDVVLCVGFLGEQIQESIDDGAQFGLSVRYSFDGDVLLGTGGALRRALPLLGQHFFVLYGDSYLNCSFAEAQAAYESSGCLGLMTVLRNAGRWDNSNVRWKDSRLIEYNKRFPSADMEWVDYGLSVLSSRVFNNTVPDLSDVFTVLSMHGELAGLAMSERFYEIGSWRGRAETESYLLNRTAL